METIKKLAEKYKKASDEVYFKRKRSKKVWVGHRPSISYRGAINSKDKTTLAELSASISEATGTDVNEVANAIIYAYTTPYIADSKSGVKVGSYTIPSISMRVDVYTSLETHIHPEYGIKIFFIDFESAEAVCLHWWVIFNNYMEMQKQQPWRCLDLKDAQRNDGM